MNGLLQFLQTPAGQGLLSAGLGVAANAGRGGTWNAIGRGGLMGLQGYQAAAEQERLKPMRDAEMQLGLLNLNKAKRDASTEQAISDAAAQSFRTPEQAASMSVGPTQDGGVVQYAPGFDQQMFTQRLSGIAPLKAMEMEANLRKQNAPIQVAAGASLVDPVTRKPVYTAPKETDLPSAVREYQFAQNQGYKGSFEQWSNTQNTSKAPRVAVDLRDPTAVAKVGLDIQDKVRNAFKGDNVIASQYRAMQAASTDPSPQGDTALLYSFFKVLDPESTVREGEVQMVNANRSIPDRFKAYAQRLAGGGSLLPTERQDLLTQAARQVQGRMPRAEQDLKAYRENATKLGLDPNTYAPNPYAGLNFGEKKQPKGAGGGARFLGFE